MHIIYCISSPLFPNRAMLKHTNAEIKLITDVNIHLTIENGICGGRCEPAFLKAETNNEYINTNFDKNKDTESHIVSLDASSLYPTTVPEKLRCGKFKYVDDISVFTAEYALNIDKSGNGFYAFLVDIHYPSDSYDEHEELPLLCNQETPPGNNVKKYYFFFSVYFL